jgi:hypothetical protein
MHLLDMFPERSAERWFYIMRKRVIAGRAVRQGTSSNEVWGKKKPTHVKSDSKSEGMKIAAAAERIR